MKMIINIPDEQYEYIRLSDKNTFAAVSSKECMLHAIKNGTPISNNFELIKYYVGEISEYCKEHRCATCFLSTNGSCNLLKSSPDQWKGIEKHETN